MAQKQKRKFAALILSHGRADNVLTVKMFEKYGYKGDWYIVCDDQDKQLDEYRKRYGDRVIVFDKEEAAKITDAGDNQSQRDSVIYARNACWEIAANLGLTHFVQLDDDYSFIQYKWDSDLRYITKLFHIRDLDRIFNAFLNLLDNTNAKCVAMAQAGDFLGGTESGICKPFTLSRKMMNTWFCRTDKPINIRGRMNDDVNAYVCDGNVGDLYFTVPHLSLQQAITQTQAGGLTEMYLRAGTYVKSFYTVMMCPSAVHVGTIGKKRRLHHRIDWKKAVPCIVSERYCKSDKGKAK